jgi:hypothetical protein
MLMQLGETIATYDVAMALRGESGKFDVTSPAGETYHVTCKPDHTISSLEWSGNGATPQPFLIRKVAEPVSPEPVKDQGKESVKVTAPAIAEGGVPAWAGRAPFLIENQGEETKASNSDGLTPLAKTDSPEIGSPKIIDAQPEKLEVADFDFLYLESDPKTGRPSACVCVKDGPLTKARTLMTPVCTTLIEFDAEVRRLHSQLDEIRSRARKQFYKTYASVASA